MHTISHDNGIPSHLIFVRHVIKNISCQIHSPTICIHRQESSRKKSITFDLVILNKRMNAQAIIKPPQICLCCQDSNKRSTVGPNLPSFRRPIKQHPTDQNDFEPLKHF
ncbi:hypothetical protein GQ457_11G021350 [Hibiscus cannabinus]